MNGSLKRTLTGVLAGVLAVGSALLAPAQAQAAGATWQDGWCVVDEGVAVVVDFSEAPEAQWPDYAKDGDGWEVRCITPPEELTKAVAASTDLQGALIAAGFDYETNASGLIIEVEGVPAPPTRPRVSGRSARARSPWTPGAPGMRATMPGGCLPVPRRTGTTSTAR
ncbi:MAG: hypothetical protein QM708_06235 [Propioniciclava sp.]|uniref:hypothetical protein n=1 Tax=Propioniciclava sp. TaxID=2038686 RepID=UPI0039E38517